MLPLSVLDLAPITQGSSVAQALANTRALAQVAERFGYRRFWLAEHHGMPGIASAATSVVIAHVAAGTRTIRVGAGGIMLPNHSPLVVAEQFGTLAALFPDRIDLGLGRAPGSDQPTMRALRRTAESADAFPYDVAELLGYFDPPAPSPGMRTVRAVPGAGANVPVWILGSSLFGARLAAAMGLPFAFASHFAPAMLMHAIDIYRSEFRPSKYLEKSYLMLGVNSFAAETDEEAQWLFTSMQRSFFNLRRGHPTQLAPPSRDVENEMTPAERAMLQEVLACTVVGSRTTVAAGLRSFAADTGADEFMINAQIYDFEARVRSFEITALANSDSAG
jgi:luciferase family oxidoreductase group 1